MIALLPVRGICFLLQSAYINTALDNEFKQDGKPKRDNEIP